MAADVTALPAGFTLDQPAGVPEGFTLDAVRPASGAYEAFLSGVQGSATGLALRGRLPDIVLDAQHAKWYEKALASIGQMGAEVPAMWGGAVLGGGAGKI